jgi:hypothetical protein
MGFEVEKKAQFFSKVRSFFICLLDFGFRLRMGKTLPPQTREIGCTRKKTEYHKNSHTRFILNIPCYKNFKFLS